MSCLGVNFWCQPCVNFWCQPCVNFWCQPCVSMVSIFFQDRGKRGVEAHPLVSGGGPKFSQLIFGEEKLSLQKYFFHFGCKLFFCGRGSFGEEKLSWPWCQPLVFTSGLGWDRQGEAFVKNKKNKSVRVGSKTLLFLFLCLASEPPGQSRQARGGVKASRCPAGTCPRGT
jgi:hypothetical protein